MEIIISVGGRWHFYQIALAAQKVGYLKKFITGVYFKNLNTKFWYHIGSQLFDISKLTIRFEPKINSKLVKPIFIPEVLAKMLEKMHVINDAQTVWLKYNLFDFLSIPFITKCDIFHWLDGFGLYAGKKAKEKGAILIVDRGLLHPREVKETLQIEYEKFGINRCYPDDLLIEKLEQEYEMADYIFVPSKAVYDSFVKFGISPSKLVLIPYGVDLERFGKTLNKKNEKFRVLFVGTLSLRKGVHYLMEAWKQLKIPDGELILVGKIEPGFEKIIKKYKDLVKYFPEMAHNLLADIYAISTVFCFPSLAEGSARVIYEAMASGLPIIYTDKCGAVARDGVDGFQIPIRDIESIKEKIFYFYKHREMAISMGENARKWIKNFSWEKYQDNLISAWKKIVNERGKIC
jgi:glycosyltransferase involved in cell wall biosynthesis